MSANGSSSLHHPTIAVALAFGYIALMNPPSNRPRPVRELFAGLGVPEHILAEQERMDALFAAHFGKPGLDQPLWRLPFVSVSTKLGS